MATVVSPYVPRHDVPLKHDAAADGVVHVTIANPPEYGVLVVSPRAHTSTANAR